MYNNQLETFIHVAQAGSFSKAAEHAFITPQAVIKQITLLENSLNLKLFERTRRGVTLTAAGKSLYKDAKYIIQYSKDSLERARTAMRDSENTIRVGTSMMYTYSISVKIQMTYSWLLVIGIMFIPF